VCKETKDKELIAAARSLAHQIALAGGPDLRDLPDDELVKQLIEVAGHVGKAAAAAGVTMYQAAQAMKAFALAGASPTQPNT